MNVSKGLMLEENIESFDDRINKRKDFFIKNEQNN